MFYLEFRYLCFSTDYWCFLGMIKWAIIWSKGKLDMISTAIPQMYLVSELKALITDKPSFVGQAQAEAKISYNFV